MKISTEIASAAQLVGEERAIEYIARAGFDAWDFSMFDMYRYNRQTKELVLSDHPLCGNDYLKFARRLKQVGLDHGIKCNQSHAPFPNIGGDSLSYLKRAIECTAEAGGEICVVHPKIYAAAGENAELYSGLISFSKGYGVKIATENMWDWDDGKDQAFRIECSSPESFIQHIDEVNDDFMVACLDIGHAEMRGLDTTAVEMIKKLGRRLQALHIHDNDKHHDSHEIPYSMAIDFEPIIRALKEIGYSGYLTLEASEYLKNSGYTKENVLDGLKKMAAAAKRMSGLYESL